MRRALLPILIFSTFCAGGRGGSQSSAVPGHGAITIAILPNPIMATKATSDEYDFPFEVVVRETGGRPIQVDRVTANVYALGGLRIGDETYDVQRINSLGYSTSIPASGELRYRFNPRRSVPTEALFNSVSAEVIVDGHDDTNTATRATTTVTVRR